MFKKSMQHFLLFCIVAALFLSCVGELSNSNNCEEKSYFGSIVHQAKCSGCKNELKICLENCKGEADKNAKNNCENKCQTNYCECVLNAECVEGECREEIWEKTCQKHMGDLSDYVLTDDDESSNNGISGRLSSDSDGGKSDKCLGCNHELNRDCSDSGLWTSRLYVMRHLSNDCANNFREKSKVCSEKCSSGHESCVDDCVNEGKEKFPVKAGLKYVGNGERYNKFIDKCKYGPGGCDENFCACIAGNDCLAISCCPEESWGKDCEGRFGDYEEFSKRVKSRN